MPYYCDLVVFQRGLFAAPKARISRSDMTEQLWYYLDSNRETQGPLELAALMRMLRSTSPGGKTLVWTDGMPGWVPANACDELLKRLPTAQRPPPPPPPEAPPPQASATGATPDQGAVASSASLHPWRRFFARYLDLMVFAILLGMVLEVLLEADSELGRLSNNNALFGALTILIFAPVEAILFAVFGSTLGKALYAVNVRQSDGKPLHPRQAIARAFDVCLRGMGLGIPFVSLVTTFVGYRTLRRIGAASWDQDRGLSVQHGRLGWLRITLITLAWLTILGLVAFGIYAKVHNL